MVVGELAHERDLIIIGGGPGGYHAAIRATQLGKSVTLIEKEELGGVCLNKGCIPSKVFTEAASRYQDAQKDFDFGIESSSMRFNYETLLSYKESVIKQLRTGVEGLCKANKIEVIKGTAFFLSENKIGVEQGEQYEVYSFSNSIIATGGKLKDFHLASRDERILNAYSISELNELPSHLIVYGSDYISLEMLMSFQQFGSEVTLILDEEKDDFSFDKSINRELTRILKKLGISILKKCTLEEVEATSEEVLVTIQKNGEFQKLAASHFFHSSRIEANIKNLGLDRAGIELTQNGFVKTNALCQTSVPHIYAIGDVTEGPTLAVRSIKEGKIVAETISGLSTEKDLMFLPKVVRTLPPIASVGLTEEEAIQEGFEILTSEFPLASNGFSTLTSKKEGFSKVIKDKKNDLILGVHIIGEGAIELISSGTFALEMVGRQEDLQFPLYPHPSINEALLEAVEGLSGHAVHLAPKKKRDKVK